VHPSDGRSAPRVGSRATRGPSRSGGFTYATVLVLVTIMGIMAGVAQEMTWRAARAERETELMFRGEAYVHAIESYRLVNGRYPRDLQDLVRDPNSPTRRHLRALYPDPFAKDKAAGWHLVQAADGGIQGVASTSEVEPLKKGNFPKRWKDFEHAKTYRDWVFMDVPRTTATGIPLTPGGALPPTGTPTPGLTPIATPTPTFPPGTTPIPQPTSP
jgi:type II secretory pathway pseudopilin PulG